MRCDPALLIARIRDRCPVFREVGGSGELADALKDSRARPGAYVVPTRDEKISRIAGSSRVVRKRVRAQFTVVLICNNYSQKLITAADALKPCIDQLEAALENWKPTPDATGCEWQSGATFDYRSDRIVWEELYSTETATTRGDNP